MFGCSSAPVTHASRSNFRVLSSDALCSSLRVLTRDATSEAALHANAHASHPALADRLFELERTNRAARSPTATRSRARPRCRSRAPGRSCHAGASRWCTRRVPQGSALALQATARSTPSWVNRRALKTPRPRSRRANTSGSPRGPLIGDLLLREDDQRPSRSPWPGSGLRRGVAVRARGEGSRPPPNERRQTIPTPR